MLRKVWRQTALISQSLSTSAVTWQSSPFCSKTCKYSRRSRYGIRISYELWNNQMFPIPGRTRDAPIGARLRAEEENRLGPTALPTLTFGSLGGPEARFDRF